MRGLRGRKLSRLKWHNRPRNKRLNNRMTTIFHSDMTETPDTAASVMTLFSPTKEGIISFASQVINEVADGKRDPLQILVLCKTMEEIADKIRKGTIEFQVREAEKYGDKPFEFQGTELHYTSVKTDYDYANCKDPVLNWLEKIGEENAKQIEGRKKFLKAVPYEGLTELDEGSGELIKIYPPAKKERMGLKVFLK